jgi:Kef-type K+ transport system membrane component KefB
MNRRNKKMSILTRFKDIMASNINALLDKAEDPEKMIDQCLRNLNTDLGKVKSVAAIIGAFLAGMALSEAVSHRVHDLAHGVTELLVPFFLAGIGLHLDLSALANRSTLVLSVIILAAAILSKLVGCGLGALPLGRADALRVGIGMMPRGEVGLVVAQLGLSLGVITQGVYGVVVFMAVATTLIAPPLLTWAYRDLISGKDGTEVFRLG